MLLDYNLEKKICGYIKMDGKRGKIKKKGQKYD